MKVLVTGANGFLSGHIIRELIRQGYEVRGMIRPGATTPALKGLDVELFYGNLSNSDDICKAVTGCDVVIHAAADTSQAHRKVSDYFPINVVATETLISAIRQQGCKRMIYISTANTFGLGSADVPGNEDTPPSEFMLKSGYAWSKFMAQTKVLEAVRNKQIEAVIVNPTFMLGPDDYNPGSGRIFNMILGKRYVFCPPGGKNFVDVRDAALAVVNAVEAGKNGECYLLAGTNLSYRNFFKTVKTRANQKGIIIGIHPILLKIAGKVGDFLKYAGCKFELNSVNASLLCRQPFIDNSKAVKVLKLPVTDINKTISDYLAWKENIKK
ncbi:MAG: NAD-dependent epimerase/dehydratase family protein [Bacteroidota bacterium]